MVIVKPRRHRRHGLRVVVTCLVATVATAALMTGGNQGMPSYRLTGNPDPTPAQRAAAANLVQQRAAALARANAHVNAVSETLSGLQAQAEVATENYDKAVAEEQQAAQGYQAAQRRLTAARQAEAKTSARLGGQAAADWESQGGVGPMTVMLGGPGGPTGYLNALGIEQVLAQHRTSTLAAQQGATAVASAFSQQAADLLATKQADVTSVQALQQVALTAVTRAQNAERAAKSTQGQAAQLLAIAKSNSARLQQQHQAAVRAAQRAAAAQAAAQAKAQGDGGAALLVTGGSTAWTAGSGASAAQGNVAANWALTQIGKPYQWGAAGPDSYDCSGLSMDAWAKAGISLGHFTGWQWTAGPHVPLNQLQRGDLVFYATNPADPATIHHVGIYIGDNFMVDAPFTGANVRIDSIFQPGLIGAVRPAN